MARSFPASIRGFAVSMLENSAVIRPASTSVIAGPVPRNGTCCRSMPVMCLSNSMLMCGERARAGRGVVEVPGLALASAISSPNVLCRHVGMHDQHVGDAGDLGDRGKILAGIVARLLGHRGQHRDGARAHQQRVAVGGRIAHRLDADDAAAAATILDEEVLSVLRQFLRENPRQDVGAAAGRGIDDELDRPRRIVGLRKCVGGEREEAGERKPSTPAYHGRPPVRSCSSVFRRVLERLRIVAHLPKRAA